MNQFILSLVSAIFIGGTAGYLGSLMVTKRMGLVGGPLGHLALPGVALALVYHFNPFFGALLTIVLGGIFVWLLEIKTRAPMEALTGLVFAAGVATGFLILPFGNESELEEALVGNIAKISLQDTIMALVIGSLIFYLIKKIYSKLILSEISEDLARVEGINVKKYNLLYLICVAFTVALTVKIVGGLLPVALIVIPALTAKNLSGNLKEYAYGSLALGSLSCVFGILFFGISHSPTGLLIILTSTAFFLISLFFKK